MWPWSDRRYTSAQGIPLFNKAFEGLKKFDKLQGYYTFQEVKQYCCRWLGMSLGFISFWWQWTCGSAATHTVSPIRNSVLKASATSMSCANLLLNSNIVFLRVQKKKSFSEDVLVFLVRSGFHTIVFKETWSNRPVLILMETHSHTNAWQNERSRFIKHWLHFLQ